jgi:hypothetical protein
MSADLQRNMEAMSRYADQETIDRAFPKPKNRWLCLWYDGNANRATVIDFGDDPTNGPYGNADMIIDKLNEVVVPTARSDDIMINAMISIWGNEPPTIWIDNEEVTDIATVLIG